MSKSNRISEKTNEQNVSWQEDFQFAEYWLDQRNLAGMNGRRMSIFSSIIHCGSAQAGSHGFIPTLADNKLAAKFWESSSKMSA